MREVLPELFHDPMSPFCRKVRIVLDEMGVRFSLTQEDVSLRREEFLALNPAGEVPVLVDGNGFALADSQAIVEFVQDVRKEPDLLGPDPAQRAETRRLVAWFDRKMYRDVTSVIIEEKIHKWRQKRGKPDSAVLAAARGRLRLHLDYMESLLATRFWLASERFSLADIAAASQISCIDYVGDIPWSSSQATREWYARIKSRPSFQPILDDRLAGMPPDDHYADPDF